jgi:serine/threonine protein kinase
MIAFPCASCQKILSVKDELGGKKVKCPGCGNVSLVPSAAAMSPIAAEPAQTLPQSPPAPVADAPGSPSILEQATVPPPSVSDVTPSALPQEPGADARLTDFLAPPQADDELGRLGGFRILKILGHGGMGVVFHAEDLKLGRRVAIKAMLPHLAGSQAAQRRFLREARAAAALEHDHIVPILQVGEDRGAPFIVMPFLKGEALDQRLRRDGNTPILEVLRIGREVAKALAAAHAAGLIHRDIKPANIWLEGEPGASATGGRVKILDFGLARLTKGEQNLTQSGAILGTPSYMAPEQAQTQKIDGRADLFSLGVVLYRLCTGVLPFPGHDTMSTLMSLATHNPAPPRAGHPEVPQELSDLIMKLLEKDPSWRPASAQQVVNAIQSIEHRLTSNTTPAVPVARPIAPAPAPRPKAAIQQPSPFAGLASTGTVVAVPPRPVRSATPAPAPTPASKSRKPVLVVAGAGLGAAVVFAVIVWRPWSGAPAADDSRTEDPPPKKGEPPAFTNSLGMEFVLVPKGKAWLGGGGGKVGDKEVDIRYDFYLGKYEVTTEEWQKVTGSKPRHNAVPKAAPEERKRFPVVASWDDCQVFIERLNKQVKDAGWVYRLPTEVEWECACRGGPGQKKEDYGFDFYFENPTNTPANEKANFGNRSGGRTCKVGSYPPNRLGLHDMHGNVFEWCGDAVPTRVGPPIQFVDAGVSPLCRPFRGGGWVSGPEYGTAAYRFARSQDFFNGGIGMRVARVPIGAALVKDPPDESKKPVAGGFLATLKKVDVSKDGTWLVIDKGPIGKPAGDESLRVAENVKVFHAIVMPGPGKGFSIEAGVPIEQGLRNLIFTKPLRCWLLTNDKKGVTEIRAVTKGRIGKKKVFLENPPIKEGAFANQLGMEFVLVNWQQQTAGCDDAAICANRPVVAAVGLALDRRGPGPVSPAAWQAPQIFVRTL